MSAKTCIISVECMSKSVEITKLKMLYQTNCDEASINQSRNDKLGQENDQLAQIIKNYEYNGEISRKGKFFFEVSLHPGSNICQV